MRIVTLLAGLVLLGLLTTCRNAAHQEAEAVITDIRQTYAPDKRVALFNVEAVPAPNGRIALQGETNLPAAKAALLARLDSLGQSIEDNLTVLPAADLGELTYGLVKVSPCNIRSEARHSAELATQAVLGTPLRVYKKEGDWYLVQTPDGYLGWLDSGGFQPLDRAGLTTWQQANRVIFDADYGYVLEQPLTPGEPSRVIVDLLPGSILETTGETDGSYSQVKCPDGTTGYVMSDLLQPLDDWFAGRQPTAEAVINTAYRFLGRPYLWGGTSAKGMDCSGFTKTAFRLNGMLLPRDASQQVHTGAEVTTDTTLAGLQPGDLLLFGRKATAHQKEKITHVGLYLGDGRMIHAGADNGAVRVQSLRRGDPDFAEHRLQSFVRAKRMLETPGKHGVVWLREAPFYFQEKELVQ